MIKNIIHCNFHITDLLPLYYQIHFQIINEIGKLLKIDCMGLIEEVIRDSQREEEIMKFISPTFRQKIIV